MQYRNVVRVSDGSFVFNRGKIKAGRKKSEYVGYGIHVDDLVFHLQGGHDAFIRYDGYINKMVNSDVSKYTATIIATKRLKAGELLFQLSTLYGNDRQSDAQELRIATKRN